MIDFHNNLIEANNPLKVALEKLNTVPEALTLFVVDAAGKLVGTLTDGDIRRGLLEGKKIEDGIEHFMNKNFRYLQKNTFQLKEIDELKEKGVKLLPLLDAEKRICKVIDLKNTKTLLPVEAIIMAGGRGERLKPLTDTVPKPLLKVGDKPIIEYNIDRLISYGVDNFNISIRYLGNMLEAYFGDGSKKGVTISFIHEDEPLGTIGAVSLIKEFMFDYVLIMNSDLLTNIDFEEFFRAFVESGADMAVASIPYNVNVPYAVLETDGDYISSFKEKPTFTYYSNGGIYLVKKNVLKRIPVNTHYNATDLIEEIIKTTNKVIHYPFFGYWLDIGKHEDFLKAQEDIKHIHF
jgi:dTDP-glucose pyrophosphorylase